MEDPGNLQKFEIGDKVYIRKDCREIFKNIVAKLQQSLEKIHIILEEIYIISILICWIEMEVVGHGWLGCYSQFITEKSKKL